MAYILHIDTSGNTGLTAIAHDGKILSQRTNTDSRNHASVINVHVQELLDELLIKMKDISAIAVCGGPGSYTGLRIGLSTAKGMCYALNIPLLLHNKLLLLTVNQYYNYLSEYEFYACILPAREKEYFISIYSKKLDEVLAPKHIYTEELAKIFDNYGSKLLLTGNINNEIQDLLNGENVKIIDNQHIDLSSWATYSFERYNCNEFVSLAHAAPFYLKEVYTHKSKNVI
jgi:tRNA threonylcarbamoyladenosine biosynthesis protein TsaB